MASSPKKKASKKPAKPKAQKKTAARSKAPAARAKTAKPAKKAARAPTKASAEKGAGFRQENFRTQRRAKKGQHESGVFGRRESHLAGQEPQREKARSVHPLPEREVAPSARCDGRLDGGSRERQSSFSRRGKRGLRLWDAPGRRGSDAYDRDFALSLLSQEQDALYEIDQALKRIELGTYGTCEMSGKSISHARLEAIPFARFTVECQSQLEKQNKASRVRQSVTSLFGLTDEEGAEGEEEEAKADDSKD